MKLLILGGTSEASELGYALANDPKFQATISLAGRTQNPVPQSLPTRSGGFGGTEGLVRYLVEHHVEALIDATHPFAAQITRNAEAAAQQTSIPLLVIWRPAWCKQPGDRWIEVADMHQAALALGPLPRRVLLTIGQKDLEPFAAAPWHHYVLRSVEAPRQKYLPQHAEVITARGPFTVEDEYTLLCERRIELLVTKNSGGTATEAKLIAARMLNLPVVIVTRPAPPTAETVATVPEALAWLARRHAASQRGE